MDKAVVSILQDLLELVTDLNDNKLESEPASGNAHVVAQRVELVRARIHSIIPQAERELSAESAGLAEAVGS